MEKFIYVATHTVRHEGSITISIHETVEGANARAEAAWVDNYKDSKLGENRKSKIKEDGSFYGTVFDSIFHVDKLPLRE